MSRGGWIVVVGISVVIALTLGFPYSCGQSECIDLTSGCPPTCLNVLGMEFEGGAPPILPVLAVILIGLAVGVTSGLAISKLRSSRSL
jgi:ribose/xylose/arabinose/galactoside ABC-type transport system permease subunit